ncbi:NAD(P)H-hydrate dehydratase [Vibrio sp. LaRot3]|uniref:NAD(P)H-hydrate dehydratase n=1 Tax=Vibrio sp. LaRot3 TaxID=2998829 RepID=UPI0022CE0568|nr:NAD(P)H-hydrate dehydratase [Vibrio sp. LaRot3]MDA0150113.1 NAD(P)H-hydrate dehydratase [Vibrio sp. LaRot3]
MTHSSDLYTAEQVRNGEKLAADAVNVTMFELMERAGRAAFEVIVNHYPMPTRIVVICGGGNNGGDGYIVAKLAIQSGYQTDVWAIKSSKSLKGDARQAFEDFIAAGGQVSNPNLARLREPQPLLIVDALLGTGFQGELREEFQQIIQAINQSHADVLAVDVPSGLCSDTGAVSSCAVRANHTVTFIGTKQGLVTGQARDYVGELHFKGLGIEQAFRRLVEPSAQIIVQLPRFHRKESSHKGHHGRALLIGGGKGLGGAILLASKACLKSGAGLTACLTEPSNVTAGIMGSPEVMYSTWEEANTIERLSWCDAIALGPGLGFSDEAKKLFQNVVTSRKSKVLDADALTMLAERPNYDNSRIITPHPGEAARLLNCGNTEIEADRYSAVVKLQRQYGGVVVLKGAGTLVADENRVFVCGAGNAGMATGGMGDVLTGVIVAFLAQGLPLIDAAKSGVLAHSLAADADVAQRGMIGLSASDVIGSLRAVINSA